MKSLKVLVVENDSVAAAEVRYRLERLGCRVPETAESGEAALELLEKEHFNLVLMDISLPGDLDGIETAAEMRFQYRIPVIFISGYSDESTILRAAAVEPCGYIVKPVDSRSLYISIRMAMARYDLEKKCLGEECRPGLQGEELQVFDSVSRHRVSSLDNSDIITGENTASPEGREEFDKQVILDAMPEAVLLLDSGGEILWANRAAALSSGMSRESMKGKQGSMVFGFQFQEETILRPETRVTDRGQCEKEVVSPRGRSCLVKRNPVFDKDNNISGFVVTIEDITEQKLADKALFENQQSLEMILKGGNIGYWNWDIPTGHVTFNRIWAKMLGYHLSDVEPVIDTWRDHIHPEDRDELMEKFETLIAAEESSFESVYRGETKSGQWKWFLGNYFVMEKDNARSRRIASVTIDITNRKRAEEEIKRLNSELESRVALRTDELKSANRELKEFAYVVSHDLKAPLRGISQLAGWLKNDFQNVINDEGKMHIDLIMNRARRMNQLIDGILEYSRVGRAEGRSEVVDCNSLVNEVVELTMPPDSVQVVCENELPLLLADRLRLEQVFLNLIGNAIKYMKEGGGTVTVSSKKVEKAWQFCVADNGQGIDSRYHEKIFKIFQTLNKQDDEESTGIGLTLVKKIIENSGGNIWLESEAGRGSRFFFTVSEDEALYEKQKTGTGC